MAFVMHFDSAGHLDFACSGTVVSTNVVMTAGHCAVDETTGVARDPSGFVVVTGAVDWTDTTNRRLSKVSQVIVNPGFDLSTGSLDAALLVLSSSTTAPSIPLVTPQAVVPAGTGAIIAGWGETYAGSPTLPTVLRTASTVVQAPSYCAQFNPLYVPSTELCSVNYPYADTGTCNGDSGGPLVAVDSNHNPVDIGITSRGPTDCNTSSADDFTAVGAVSSWASGWIHAVAPRPQPPQLPSMTFATARGYVRQTLAGVLSTRFAHRHRYQTSCSRRAASRISCGFTLWTGPNDYYGNIAVFYLIGSSNQIQWTDTYIIHEVNDHCYLRSGHRKSCQIHTRRGTF